ncbi:MAG: hypothetical protein HC905_27485 [Bacteroidales bacterium]|nr:hypothetical protein [Bacteroidales bacterium]
MNDSRNFRISLSGSTLIISSLFHFWILGGKFKYLGFQGEKIENLVGVLIAVVSSPVLGFIFSTITIALLQYFLGI